MIKLKKIKLINFCGYKNFELDLSKEWLVLFGTNGCGKSNFLEAVALLSYPWTIASREDTTMFFRRLTYHLDYQPGLEGFDKNKNEMLIEGIFSTDNGDKKVVIRNNWIPEESGVIINDLDISTPIADIIDADNLMNMQFFQLKSQYREKFLDFAEAIYGFKCDIPNLPQNIVQEYDDDEDEYLCFYTDFVITKFNNTRVHFKRMSAGEKKIATMLRILFNRCYGKNNILLIDNIEQHIYFKRHMKLIEKMKEYFSNSQIIATTHSPVIINEIDKTYLLDLESQLNG